MTSFLTKMNIDLTKKGQNLLNLPPLDKDSLLSRAEDWFDILHKKIPFENLRTSFEDMCQNHTTRSISAFDLIAAYDQFQETEKERKRLNFEQTMTEIEAAKKTPNYAPCEMCFDCGFTQVTRYFNGEAVKGVIKCHSCGYWQRYREKHGL